MSLCELENDSSLALHCDSFSWTAVTRLSLFPPMSCVRYSQSRAERFCRRRRAADRPHCRCSTTEYTENRILRYPGLEQEIRTGIRPNTSSILPQEHWLWYPMGLDLPWYYVQSSAHQTLSLSSPISFAQDVDASCLRGVLDSYQGSESSQRRGTLRTTVPESFS